MDVNMVPDNKLTKRECQVVQLIAEAKRNKQIAFELGLTLGSVRVYIHRIMEKLHMSNRTQIAVWIVKGRVGITGLLIMLISSLSSLSQTISITGPTGKVKAGTSATLTISVSGAVGKNIAGQQFSISNLPWPATPTIGAAGSTANKQIDCGTVAGGLNCVVVGMNTTVFGDGVLGTIQVTLPRNISSGTATLAILNTLGASPEGNPVTIGASSPFALSITSLCDVDASGTVTISDYNLLKPQILGLVTCNTADLNSDGKCDILDAQIIGTAASGGACNAQ